MTISNYLWSLLIHLLFDHFSEFKSMKWETNFHPVPVLGRIALSLSLTLRFPDPSQVVDKNLATMGPEILFSTGVGACRKAPKPKAFPDSSSALDKFQSAMKIDAASSLTQLRILITKSGTSAPPPRQQ